MGDTTADAFVIPTIDIAPYLEDPSSAEALQVIENVKQACMTTGFFSLVGHGIPRELQDRVLKACETLFSLPLEEKKTLMSTTGLRNRGYEQIGSQVLQDGALPDMKEGFYVGKNIPSNDERTKEHPYFMGENIFPSNIPDSQLREPTEAYYSQVLALGIKILEVLARGLPFGGDVFKEFTTGDLLCFVRLLHYPPQKSTDARQLGVGAHTDWGAITLLLQDDKGGLEVLDDRTGEWVAVDPNPDAYVVNIGDMLALWTSNVYKSNTHRVINKSTSDRYSVPFFFDGNPNTKLAPFDGSLPAGGKVLTAEQHLLERLKATYGRASKAEAKGAVSAY